MLKLVLGAAAALALLVAAPASACDDCKNCPHHKDTTAQVQGKGAVAEADKKDEKAGCHCDHTASKDCKCGEKCKCDDCPVHGKKAEKTEKKS